MKGDWQIAAMASPLYSLPCITAGCGKKGDPVPPQAKLLAAVASLIADRGTEGVNLRWSLTIQVRVSAPLSSFAVRSFCGSGLSWMPAKFPAHGNDKHRRCRFATAGEK